MAKKLILAYSGGLDTSVAVHWLTQERGYDVIALTVDVGLESDRAAIEERAIATGAVGFRWVDAREDFIRFFAFPALAAGRGRSGKPA